MDNLRIFIRNMYDKSSILLIMNDISEMRNKIDNLQNDNKILSKQLNDNQKTFNDQNNLILGLKKGKIQIIPF